MDKVKDVGIVVLVFVVGIFAMLGGFTWLWGALLTIAEILIVGTVYAAMFIAIATIAVIATGFMFESAENNETIFA